MAKRVLVVMADGCEDVEAVAAIDVLNRVGVNVTIAGLSEGPVKAAYGNTIGVDISLDETDDLYDGIVFPGGTKNAQALAANPRVVELTKRHFKEGRMVAAICASPSLVLAEAAGVVRDRRATGDPGFNEKLAAGGAKLTDEAVTVDGNLITAMGPGAALRFGLAMAEYLGHKDKAQELAKKWRITA